MRPDFQSVAYIGSTPCWSWPSVLVGFGVWSNRLSAHIARSVDPHSITHGTVCMQTLLYLCACELDLYLGQEETWKKENTYLLSTGYREREYNDMDSPVPDYEGVRESARTHVCRPMSLCRVRKLYICLYVTPKHTLLYCQIKNDFSG